MARFDWVDHLPIHSIRSIYGQIETNTLQIVGMVWIPTQRLLSLTGQEITLPYKSQVGYSHKNPSSHHRMTTFILKISSSGASNGNTTIKAQISRDGISLHLRLAASIIL
ncbi:MAG: hypothetical protein A2Z14_18360 [Chloroflexi bacterium RBG_16_48_8]|nr:MAG: hypothetical protein A2Z14_18360 [Chloroflexi bacterium RBG_16_48_8]